MIEQYSSEWFAERLGKVTASRIADVVAQTRSGWGASRANYAAELIAERLTGAMQNGFTSPAMQWGIDHEDDAKAAYAFRTDNPVAPAGFISHPRIEAAGASPDGFVTDAGLIEIKCPNTSTHLDTLLGGKPADKYLLQMQWQMACSGRAWCDFVSFDPRLPESMCLHITRIDRDDEKIAELEREVEIFLAEIDAKVAKLRKRYETEAA